MDKGAIPQKEWPCAGIPLMIRELPPSKEFWFKIDGCSLFAIEDGEEIEIAGFQLLDDSDGVKVYETYRGASRTGPRSDFTFVIRKKEAADDPKGK